MGKKTNSHSERPRSPWVLFWRRFRRNKLALGGAGIILVLFIIAAFAPLLAPYDPDALDIKGLLAPPSAQHLMGTDDLGRDVLSRIIWGARVSLLVGFVAVGISVSVGIILGALAGYYGGSIDSMIMRFVDVMLCFPTFFLILAVIAFWEPSIWKIMLVIGLTSWMGVTRLIRAEFLTLKERDYVQAARAVGGKDLRIIFRHILPNSLAPVLVNATLGIAAAILVESSLSFLGIGIQPPEPSWGNMLTAGKDNIEIAWWLSFFPGFAIFITVMGYNMLGEGIRDSIDPRLRS
ncbi:MAG TPA: ABC transporter permease [Thermodesulfobacteriota bacterium]|nr:ABC transporter permease [Thermodesulfobacteriota bacterium]HNU72178.1 ABC transporter permease [Thermodesulfobacteriota bacterium]